MPSRSDDRPEPWLRGPVPGVAPVFQPVAHALQHAVEDLRSALNGFPETALWACPAGIASVGFHLRHIAGVLDRMGAYADGRALSADEAAALAAEELPGSEPTSVLVAAVEAAVERMLARLRAADPSAASDARRVGRAGLPSTVLGLYVHAAEHTQRHVGQLLVTARVAAEG